MSKVTSNDQIQEIDIDTIQVSPFQPRRVFSDEELDELISSINTVGLIQPPVVRAITSNAKLLYYELIAGERRWRACKKVGLKKLPVIVRTITDEKAAKATLIENIQRVDLNPLEMAQALKRLIDVFQMTQEEVALKIGKKRSTVANYLRLLSLPKEVQEGVSSEQISMGHAKAILSLQAKDLQHLLHKMIVEKELTVRQAEREGNKLERSVRRKKKTSFPQQCQEEIHLEDLAQKLQDKLGAKVSIAATSRSGGKVIIHYYSYTDLERLLDLLHNYTQTT